MNAEARMTRLCAVRTAINAINRGQPMIPQLGTLRMQPAGACPCREPATATPTVMLAALSLPERAVMTALSAILAGPLTILCNGTLLKACADASLRRRFKSCNMARPAPTHTTCSAAQTAMTAARPGPLMMCKSGILRTWSAAARPKTSKRRCSPRPATLSTLVSVAPTAENAICRGWPTTQCQPENADASAPGEKPNYT